MLSPLVALAALPLAALGLGPSPAAGNAAVQQPGLLRFPITVSEGAPVERSRQSLNRLLRRQNDVALTSRKSGFFYSIEMRLGTPPQPVSVNFDTGSDELWVNPVCGKSSDPSFCQGLGRFNGSQTFVDLHRNGSVNYGTGFAAFEYGHDYVQIGSARISQQIFGVATDSAFAMTGILGAGPGLDGWDSPYPRVLDNLATQGFTNSRTFALDIRSFGSNRGSVVFGGLDTRKFTGRLEKRPIIPPAASPDGFTRYWIYLDGLRVVGANGTAVDVLDKPNGQPVLVDSGYTVSSLPSTLFDKILSAFPDATPPPQGSDLYRVPCSLVQTRGRVDFRFGQTVINVGLKDFIWQREGGSCVLGVIPDDSFPVLGDTFLRAAYVVYDWDNRNLHLANNEDCGTNLVAIGKGPDAVPSVTGECSKTEPTATSSSSSASTSSTSPSASSSVSFSNSTLTTSSSLSSGLAGAKTSSGSAAGPSPSGSGKTSGSGSAGPTTTGSGSISTVPTEARSLSSSGSGSGSGSASKPVSSPNAAYNTPAPAYTSARTQTRTYTITSCPPSVTHCTVGSVITETIAEPTMRLARSTTTSVFTTTKTVTAGCQGSASCSGGRVTTEVVTSTYLCSQSTATWTIPRTHTCSAGEYGCRPGEKKTTSYVVTVRPVTPVPAPTPVPGCNGCRMPPAAGPAPDYTPPAHPGPIQVSLAYKSPVHQPLAPANTLPAVPGPVGPGPVGSGAPCTTCRPQASSPPPVIAAAASWRMPGVTALVVGALAVAVM